MVGESLNPIFVVFANGFMYFEVHICDLHAIVCPCNYVSWLDLLVGFTLVILIIYKRGEGLCMSALSKSVVWLASVRHDHISVRLSACRFLVFAIALVNTVHESKVFRFSR